MIETPSPNFDARPAGATIDVLVLHYTGMPSAADALARLCDPAAKVSAHYLIDEDGTVHRLVDERARAWHAGVSAWAGHLGVNDVSIGIELVNPGHDGGYRDFPPAQMAALATLAADIVARHGIPAHRVLGHSDVAWARKIDPGERLDWAYLAAHGVGLWPEAVPAPAETASEAAAALLARFGYALPPTEDAEALAPVVRAFQRHFRPARIDGRMDGECRSRLAWLVARLP